MVIFSDFWVIFGSIKRLVNVHFLRFFGKKVCFFSYPQSFGLIRERYPREILQKVKKRVFFCGFFWPTKHLIKVEKRRN